jgi:hypothetical protein
MIHIKRFIEKVSITEAKQSKDIVLPIADARGLRDEIAKLLSDLYEYSVTAQDEKKEEIIEIQVKGGSFK